MNYNFDVKVGNHISPQVLNGAQSPTGSVDFLDYNACQFVLDVTSSSTPATTNYAVYTSPDNNVWTILAGSTLTFSASSNGLAVWNIDKFGNTYQRYLCLSGSQASGTSSVCAISILSMGKGTISASGGGASLGIFPTP